MQTASSLWSGILVFLSLVLAAHVLSWGCAYFHVYLMLSDKYDPIDIVPLMITNHVMMFAAMGAVAMGLGRYGVAITLAALGILLFLICIYLFA